MRWGRCVWWFSAFLSVFYLSLAVGTTMQLTMVLKLYMSFIPHKGHTSPKFRSFLSQISNWLKAFHSFLYVSLPLSTCVPFSFFYYYLVARFPALAWHVLFITHTNTHCGYRKENNMTFFRRLSGLSLFVSVLQFSFDNCLLNSNTENYLSIVLFFLVGRWLLGGLFIACVCVCLCRYSWHLIRIITFI